MTDQLDNLNAGPQDGAEFTQDLDAVIGSVGNGFAGADDERRPPLGTGQEAIVLDNRVFDNLDGLPEFEVRIERSLSRYFAAAVTDGFADACRQILWPTVVSLQKNASAPDRLLPPLAKVRKKPSFVVQSPTQPPNVEVKAKAAISAAPVAEQELTVIEVPTRAVEPTPEIILTSREAQKVS